MKPVSIRQICLISLIWLMVPAPVFATDSTIVTPVASVIVATDSIFPSSTIPTLSLTSTSSLSQKFTSFINGLKGDPKLPILVVTGPQGKTILDQPIKAGKTHLSLSPAELTPGEYSLSINDQPTLSFSWGVLTLNVDQDHYLPGEEVYLQMASLSRTGHTLCNSNLLLTINDHSVPVQKNSTCGADNVTDSPDYFATYTPTSPGLYSLTLTNQDTGLSILSSFLVKTASPYTITRTAATRINPFKSDYKMTLQVTSANFWSGIIKEQLPAGFEALTPISWQADLTPNEPKTLIYTYRAPKLSPAIFLLGPLSVGDYQETHQWSLASDATFQMQTGYYIGDGVDNRTITGVGFQPELLLIKDDTANGSYGIVWKSSSMSSEVTALLGESAADIATDAIQSFDSNGFTLGTNADVNAANIRFTWVAFRGSDCTSSGTFCVGSYTGDGTSPRALTTVGFQPNMVAIKRSGASIGVFRTSSMPTNVSQMFDGQNQEATGLFIRTLDNTGFTIGSASPVNTTSNTYWFFAFKSTTNAFAVGTYTGDGADNRAITGVGFQPQYLWNKGADLTAATKLGFNLTESYNDYTGSANDAGNVTDWIQSLDSDGFTLGSLANGNENTKTFYWVAFAGASNPSGSGTYTMKVGTYTGNGTSQSISGIGFAPDLVLIKGEAGSTNYVIFRTKLMKGDTSAYLAFATANFADGITSLDSDGFSLGSKASINTSSVIYHYQAFGNAFNPEDNTGAADFIIGAHQGNGLDDRNILRLPFQPDFVAMKHSGAASGIWRTSAQSGDLSVGFSAIAEGANYIQALNSDGFQVGSDNRSNQVNVLLHWFAFKASSTMVVNSYTGTASAQNITSAGFSPDLLWVRAPGAIEAVLRPSTVAGDSTQYFTNTVAATDRITALISTGFSVGGNRTETNTASAVYRYAAWIPNSAPSAPTTPYAEGTGNPTGIIDLTPEFSAIHNDANTDPALYYEIEVNTASDFGGTVMWDTGSTSMSSLADAARSTDVSYAGTTLTYNGTTYYWRIRFTDNKGAVGAWSATQNFSTNSAPSTPSLDSPADSATGVSLTPTLATTTTDPNSDYLRYKIEICTNVGMSTGCLTTIDQTSSQTGWSGQDAQTSTAYTSGTQASHTLQSSLSNSTTYYWRTYAIDPGGTNTWSGTQTPHSFTTLSGGGGGATFNFEGLNFEGINLN